MPHRRWSFHRYTHLQAGGAHTDDAGAPKLDDPLYAQRNPFQTFLLGAALGSSWPLLQGNAGSAVLERELDNLTVILWGICLLVGSALGMAGLLWPRSPASKAWSGLVIERVGLFLVGVAGMVYAAVVWITVPDKASVAYTATFQTAFALACWWRVAQITNRMRWWKAVAAWVEGMEMSPSMWQRIRLRLGRA